jgi:KDO2-lipid IV(A) lauroyltransferase
MKLKEKIEYRATATVLQISKILPECAVYALFKALALLLYTISARRRNLSLTNMGIAFPEKPENERKALVKKSYLNLSEGMALNTLIMTGRISDKQLLNMVETDDWGKFEKNIEASPKGFLAISGHMGNWELSSQYISLRLPRPLHVIARPTTNQLLEDRIVRPLREHFGVTVFYKKNALMRIMKAINKGGICGLLIDQKLNPGAGGLRVDFFGKSAPTTGSAALLQIRFGITVNPAFMVKTGFQKYKMIIGESIQWADNGKPMEEQVMELTRIHQKIMEDIIRKYPDQWFWMHNRWNLKGNNG